MVEPVRWGGVEGSWGVSSNGWSLQKLLMKKEGGGILGL